MEWWEIGWEVKINKGEWSFDCFEEGGEDDRKEHKRRGLLRRY